MPVGKGPAHSALDITEQQELRQAAGLPSAAPGAANGLALLGADGRLPAAQAPVSGDGNPRRAVIVGHSRVQENFEQTATAIYARPRWWNWAQALSGHRLDLVQNAGISGQSVEQIAARLAGSSAGVGFGMLTASSTIANTTVGVLGLSPLPDVAFVECAINNLLAGQSAAAVFEKVRDTIITPLRSSGIKVVMISDEMATTTQPGWTAAVAREVRLYRGILAAYCSSEGLGFVDFYSAMASATSSSMETDPLYFRDGNLHANNRGGLAGAEPLAAFIRQVFPPREDLLPACNAETSAYDSAIPQLQVNPLFNGTAAITTTGYSGTAAGSHLAAANFVRSGSASAVLSAEARADGKGQNLVFDCTFTAAADYLELRQPSYHAQAVVGGKYRAVCEVQIAGPGGAVLAAANNLRGVALSIQYNNGTTNHFVSDLAPPADDMALIGSRTLTLRTPEITIPAGTPTTFRMLVGIQANGAGGAVVRVGRMGMYRTA